MKKIITVLLIALLTFSFISVAYADTAPNNEVAPMSFIRTYKNIYVSNTSAKILQDSNWYSETTINCTWDSIEGPSSVKISCQIKYNGEWYDYSSRTISTIGNTVTFTIKGGEPFRLYVKRLSGNDGKCNFTVSLY